MKLEPVGGIFWRLDSSGNLTAYDTAGNVLGQFVGTVFVSVLNRAQDKLSANVTTTSTTDVSTGFGVTITPRFSGAVFVTARVVIQNSVSGNVSRAPLYQSTTGIPANDGAVVGSSISLLSVTVPNTANWYMLHSLLRTGLIVGQAYSFYLAKSVGAGTGTIGGSGTLDLTTIFAVEL